MIILKNGNTLEIRAAGLHDVDDINDYIVQLSADSDQEITFRLKPERLENIINDPISLMIVGIMNGEIVSTANLHGERSRDGEARAELMVSVLKHAWDKGIGRNMILFLHHWARSKGIARVYLRVRVISSYF